MKKDTRHTLTIKGEQFTPEFRRLINAAAKREGLTQAEWVFLTLCRAAECEPMLNSSTPETLDNSADLRRKLQRNSGITLKAVLYQDEIQEALAMYLGSNGFDAAPADIAIFHAISDGENTFTAEARDVRIIDA